MGIITRTGDNTRYIVRWKTHRLRPVEFMVLECCQPDQAVPKAGRQRGFADKYLAAQNQFQFLRQRIAYRFFSPP
jgi:hypothetical protein